MATKINVAGPAADILKGQKVTANPTSSPTTNGEKVPGGYKRTSSPNAAPEVTHDASKGREAKENVGGRG